MPFLLPLLPGAHDENCNSPQQRQTNTVMIFVTSSNFEGIHALMIASPAYIVIILHSLYFFLFYHLFMRTIPRSSSGGLRGI